MRPKTKLFAMKFRRILEVLCLQDLQKKLWAQFHDLFVEKRSCLLWRSDAVWTFSPCKLCKQSSGWILPIYAPKNKVVCCEIQAHFGSSRFARFMKRIRVHYHDLCVQKWGCLQWGSDAFCKLSTCKIDKKVVGAFSRFFLSRKQTFLTLLWLKLTPTCLACNEYRTSREMFWDIREYPSTFSICSWRKRNVIYVVCKSCVPERRWE